MTKKSIEETLDPENWDDLRALGHKMLDDMINRQKNISQHKFVYAPKDAREKICVPLSEDGEGETAVYEFVKNNIEPNAGVSTSPRFWGAVVGTGSAYGMLASMVAAGINSANESLPTVAGYTHRQAIEWIKELLGYPREAGGVFVSGGSEANYTAIAVARNAMAEVDMKKAGMQGVPRRMTVYVSDGGHHCLERSVELLGIGSENLRWVETGNDYRIKVDALEKAIKADREAGFNPFCVIGNAGTVDTGAFDDLNVLADLARREKMWLHVDAAFGGWVKISRTHRHLADGLERADSLAIDLHKWMYMPYGIGCTLIRDKFAHYSTFVYGHEANYISEIVNRARERSEYDNPAMLALPLSRDFRSLKVYMLLRAHGKAKYGRLIQQNIDQARYLTELIRGDPEFELTAPTASNVVCFRFNPGGLPEEKLDELNRVIARGVNEVHFWMFSDTLAKGRFSLRAAVTNHRSRREDFDFAFNLVKDLGHKVLSDLKKK